MLSPHSHPPWAKAQFSFAPGRGPNRVRGIGLWQGTPWVAGFQGAVNKCKAGPEDAKEYPTDTLGNPLQPLKGKDLPNTNTVGITPDYAQKSTFFENINRNGRKGYYCLLEGLSISEVVEHPLKVPTVPLMAPEVTAGPHL